MTTDFARLLAVLHKAGVEYIIIGGVAATVHGSSRLTQDVDVCYARTDANIDRLVRALRPLKPYLRGAPRGLPFEWSAKTLRAGLNFTLTTTSGDIDLLGEVTGGGTYDDLIGHTIDVTLFGHRTKCLNLERLIATKRAAGRPRDLEAIAELMALREEIGGERGSG
jgi:predicted nucleotidyltransferase